MATCFQCQQGNHDKCAAKLLDWPMCDCGECLHDEVLDQPLPEPRATLTVEELAEIVKAAKPYGPCGQEWRTNLAERLLPILRERGWVR